MTLEQAKIVINTQTMPMTSEEIKRFKEALAIVTANIFRR